MILQVWEDKEGGWIKARARTGINGWYGLRQQNRDTEGG